MNSASDLRERRIGLSAHDFAQLLAIRTLSSPFREKFAAASGGRLAILHAGSKRWGRGALEAAQAAAKNTFGYAAAIWTSPTRSSRSRSLNRGPAARDAPDTPFRYRDRGWLRDPYDDLRTPHPAARSARSRRHARCPRPTAVRRSTAALGRIHPNYAGGLARRCRERVARHRREAVRPLMERPGGAALWWPRFQRIARLVRGLGGALAAGITAIVAEIQGDI